MNKEKLQSEIQEIIEVPLQIDYSALGFELITLALIFPALFILFRYSNRPGSTMMFFGYTLSTLFYLPIVALFSTVSTESFTGLNSWLMLYLPAASALFALLACIGFLIFSLSFKNEN